jgi:hypothetical protein
MDKFNNIYYFDNNTYYFIIEYLLFLCDDDNSLFQKLFDLIRFLNENGHPIDFNKKAMSENISKNIIYSKKVTHPIFILLLFFDLDKVKDIINYLLESNKIKIKETYFEDKVSIGNGIEKGDECSILDVAIYLGKFDFIKFFMEEKNIKKYNQFSLRHPADFREPHIFKYLVDNTDSFNTNFLNENGENLLFELIKYGQTSYFIKYIEKKIPKEDFEKMILHKEKPQKSFIDYCIEYKNLNVLKYLKENYFNLFKKLLENNLDASYTLIEYKALDMFVFLISNGLPYNKKELFERIKYAKQFYNKLGCIELDTMKDYIKRFEKFKNKNQQK